MGGGFQSAVDRRIRPCKQILWMHELESSDWDSDISVLQDSMRELTR